MTDYVKTDWVDGVTPVDEGRMDHIEAGIDTAHDEIVSVETRVTTLEGRPVTPAVVNGQWLKGVGGVPVWTAITQADVGGLSASLALKEDTANKGAVSGYASLDANTRVLQKHTVDKLYSVGIPDASIPIVRTGATVWEPVPAAGADLSFDGDWSPGTYNDGDTVVKDGLVFLCVGGPTTAAPDATLWGTPGAGGAGLPADTVVAATTRIISNKLLAGDAQPSFRFLGNGKIEWGAGGATAPDTHLYREAAGYLRTENLLSDNSIYASYALSGSQRTVLGAIGPGTTAAIALGDDATVSLFRRSAQTLETNATLNLNRGPGAPAAQAFMNAGEAKPGWILNRDGSMTWGAGGAADLDTALYRSAAYTLRVNEILEVSQQLHVGVSNNAYIYLKQNANQGIYFGATSDTYLYRSAANTLKTGGKFIAGDDVISRAGQSSQITLGEASAGRAGVWIGDMCLYNPGVGVLKTDAGLQVSGLGSYIGYDPTTGWIINTAAKKLTLGTGVPIRFGDGSEQLTAAGGAVSYGTTLPASPVNGQEAILVDSLTAPSYQWRFRYNAGSSSSRKWEFIGGSDFFHQIDTSETINSAVYTDLATVGPVFTALYDGIYNATYGCVMVVPCANNNMQMWASPTGFDDAAVYHRIDGATVAVQHISASRTKQFSVGAGGQLRLKYKQGQAQGWQTYNRFLFVQPVRVTG